MEKEVNYKEFLEIVSLDLIEKYAIKLNPDKTMSFGTNIYHNYKLENIRWWRETDIVWAIKTKTMVVTFWKDIDCIYIAEVTR